MLKERINSPNPVCSSSVDGHSPLGEVSYFYNEIGFFPPDACFFGGGRSRRLRDPKGVKQEQIDKALEQLGLEPEDETCGPYVKLPPGMSVDDLPGNVQKLVKYTPEGEARILRRALDRALKAMQRG